MRYTVGAWDPMCWPRPRDDPPGPGALASGTVSCRRRSMRAGGIRATIVDPENWIWLTAGAVSPEPGDMSDLEVGGPRPLSDLQVPSPIHRYAQSTAPRPKIFQVVGQTLHGRNVSFQPTLW